MMSILVMIDCQVSLGKGGNEIMRPLVFPMRSFTLAQQPFAFRLIVDCDDGHWTESIAN